MENQPFRNHPGSSLSAERACREDARNRRWRPQSLALLLGLLLSPVTASAEAPEENATGEASAAWSGFGVDPRSIDLLSPPGRRVDVAGRVMHLHCTGPSGRTVVLDAGLGGFSLEWLPVQSRLADHLRVCSYDRAGYGWSGSRIGPRTSGAIVAELHALLQAAGEPGPYVLVGHSFGGYTAQLFAKRYPQDTAGLVLVDASHPQQHTRFPERASGGERAPTTGGRRYTTATPTLPEGFPVEFAEVAYHLMYARKAVGAQRRELADFETSGREVEQAGPLPSRPLIVLTRGQRVWPDTAFGEEMERAWTVLQNELAQASPDSAHWIARHSGHYIHLDEPDLVAGAVDALVARIERGAAFPPRAPDSTVP